jgi:hypothetical protein
MSDLAIQSQLEIEQETNPGKRNGSAITDLQRPKLEDLKVKWRRR